MRINEIVFQFGDELPKKKRGFQYSVDTEHGVIVVSFNEFRDIVSRYTCERKTDDNGNELYFFICYEDGLAIGRAGRA